MKMGSLFTPIEGTEKRKSAMIGERLSRAIRVTDHRRRSPSVSINFGPILGLRIFCSAMLIPRPGDAGVVHRAGLSDHPRRIRSGKTKCRICPALRCCRCAPPSRPNLAFSAIRFRERLQPDSVCVRHGLAGWGGRTRTSASWNQIRYSN